MVNSAPEVIKGVADAAEHTRQDIKPGVEGFVNAVQPDEHATTIEKSHPKGDAAPSGTEALKTPALGAVPSEQFEEIQMPKASLVPDISPEPDKTKGAEEASRYKRIVRFLNNLRFGKK